MSFGDIGMQHSIGKSLTHHPADQSSGNRRYPQSTRCHPAYSRMYRRNHPKPARRYTGHSRYHQIRILSLEIHKLSPDIVVTGEACPMWVSLVENNEYQSEGADYFVKQHINRLLDKDPMIDTIILGCTHYPLLLDKIRQFTPEPIRIISQGEYVARSLRDYLNRHPEMDARCDKGGNCRFLTTESENKFEESASIFLGRQDIKVKA